MICFFFSFILNARKYYECQRKILLNRILCPLAQAREKFKFLAVVKHKLSKVWRRCERGRKISLRWKTEQYLQITVRAKKSQFYSCIMLDMRNILEWVKPNSPFIPFSRKFVEQRELKLIQTAFTTENLN